MMESRNLNKQIEKIDKRIKLELDIINLIIDRIRTGKHKTKELNKLVNNLYEKYDSTITQTEINQLNNFIDGLSSDDYSKKMLVAFQKLGADKESELDTQRRERALQVNNRWLARGLGSREVDLKDAFIKASNKVEQQNNNHSNVILAINSVLQATYRDVLAPVEKNDSPFSKKLKNTLKFFGNIAKQKGDEIPLLDEKDDGRNEKKREHHINQTSENASNDSNENNSSSLGLSKNSRLSSS